jgi:hypothetical protein
MIEVIAAQRAVAAGSQDLKHAASQAQNGNIEGAAAGHKWQAFSAY